MGDITRQMIEKAASGDQNAIAELYELTYSSIYKTVKSMIADEDAVLDIVQDSYIKGFQSLAQLDAPENFRAWMKRIATNKAKDHLKKKKPILFTDMAGEDGEEIDFRDECLEHCPEEVLDRKETTRLMQQILSTLSDEQRLVIGMFYYEEMSVREIAQTLGCSENTVKSRLNYGRKKVEIQVKELEKKGTKLYSLAPMAFLLWLFRMDAEAAEIPSGRVLEAVSAECAAAGAAAGSGAAAAAGTKAVAGARFKAMAAKIVAGVLAVSVAGGGAMAAITALDRDEEAEASHHHSRADEEDDEEPQLREEQIPEKEEKEEMATAAAETVSSGEAAYRVVLDAYQEVMNMDSAVFLYSPESYFHGDHVIVRYHHMYQSGCFCYAYYDVDGNGVEELLVGYAQKDYPERVDIVDLYTFDGHQAVQLVDEITLGDRSRLTVYSDGTLYLFGASSATEATHSYLVIHDGTLVDAGATVADEVTDFDWQFLELPEEPASSVSFGAILADIQQALSVSQEEYDANMEAYDASYSHLGDGVMWMLMHRQSGVYTMGIWNTELDVDGDGRTELCIGRGVSPSRVEPIVIYLHDGTILYGDAVYTYTDLFYGDTAVEWDYLGG